MKKISALAFALSMLVSATALAGTFSNKDSKKYNIYKKSSGGGVTTSIGANTTQMSTCSYFPCEITNKDTGDKIKLTSKDQDLIIKDGKFQIK